jgi:hypothetical protein
LGFARQQKGYEQHGNRQYLRFAIKRPLFH